MCPFRCLKKVTRKIFIPYVLWPSVQIHIPLRPLRLFRQWSSPREERSICSPSWNRCCNYILLLLLYQESSLRIWKHRSGSFRGRFWGLWVAWGYRPWPKLKQLKRCYWRKTLKASQRQLETCGMVRYLDMREIYDFLMIFICGICWGLPRCLLYLFGRGLQLSLGISGINPLRHQCIFSMLLCSSALLASSVTKMSRPYHDALYESLEMRCGFLQRWGWCVVSRGIASVAWSARDTFSERSKTSDHIYSYLIIPLLQCRVTPCFVLFPKDTSEVWPSLILT